MAVLLTSLGKFLLSDGKLVTEEIGVLTSAVSEIANAVEAVSGGVSVPANATFDAATLSEYQTAIANAPLGSKRVAGANAVVQAMQPEHVFYIYQDDNIIINASYQGDCVVIDDGTDVSIGLGTVASSSVLSASLSVGTWTFAVLGGDNFSRSITGTVGASGSGAALILSSNPVVGEDFVSPVVFVVPRSVDGV